MGVRQSATIIFAEDLGRRSEKKHKELENGRDMAGGKITVVIVVAVVIVVIVVIIIVVVVVIIIAAFAFRELSWITHFKISTTVDVVVKSPFAVVSVLNQGSATPGVNFTSV